jgi:hypothetical protein
MNEDKPVVNPNPTQEPDRPDPADRSARRIAVAIESIDRTLGRRSIGSGRPTALVALLGEAPRTARPRPPGSDLPDRRRRGPRTS